MMNIIADTYRDIYKKRSFSPSLDIIHVYEKCMYPYILSNTRNRCPDVLDFIYKKMHISYLSNREIYELLSDY